MHAASRSAVAQKKKSFTGSNGSGSAFRIEKFMISKNIHEWDEDTDELTSLILIR